MISSTPVTNVYPALVYENDDVETTSLLYRPLIITNFSFDYLGLLIGKLVVHYFSNFIILRSYTSGLYLMLPNFTFAVWITNNNSAECCNMAKVYSLDYNCHNHKQYR